MSEMVAFPSIEALRHVVKGTEIRCKINNTPLPSIRYVGTVKLHGTNASVRIEGDQVFAQSRSRVLSIGDDNFGFAQFVEANKQLFLDMRRYFIVDETLPLTIYGEWCGKGIQNGVAISQLDRHFVIFSCLIDGKFYRADIRMDMLADEIPVWNAAGVFHIHQVPAYDIVVDFARPEAAVDRLTELTVAVENECPWGKFRGVSGVGEGIVWSPLDHSLGHDWWFKSKGLKHKKEGKAPKVEVAPEVVESMRELAEKLLPEWRLEQGLSALRERGLEIEPKNTGAYIKWISEDILKEETDVLEANGVEWKKISSFVIQNARQFFLNQP